MLDNSLMYLKGIGPIRYEALLQSGIHSVEDFLRYFPTGYTSRSGANSVLALRRQLECMNKALFAREDTSNLAVYKEMTIIGNVVSIENKRVRNNRRLLTIILSDISGMFFEVVFFSRLDWFRRAYNVGDLLVISGHPVLNGHKVSFSHPEIDIIEEEDIANYDNGVILPKYHLTEAMRKAKITNRVMRTAVKNAIDNIDNLSHFETLPFDFCRKHNLMLMEEIIPLLHFPDALEQVKKAKRRLKFEEIFLYHLSLSYSRKKIEELNNGIVINKRSKLARQLYDRLPYRLTFDQQRTLREIDTDFRSGKAMNRLLQGDVGSGKTIVSILAMLMAIDAGLQVVIMAPTEILAEQHFMTISNLLQGIDLKVCLLLGGGSNKVKKQTIQDIANGDINVIVGTHAVFQKGVKYKNLGFVVIDEQHRFGVSQRGELISLAKQSMDAVHILPHILYMTATPIPRTLTMTLYGDVDVSVIRTMPENRKPIITDVIFDNNRLQVYDFLRNELRNGRQAYIVYPLVEKSEKLELKSAVECYELVAAEFLEYNCGLLHGQMKWQDKEDVMQVFKRGGFQILVATTVVEVGIDVPNATVMLIENAERFGLSQLHQLRGRVGRGVEQSYCFLMTKDDFKYKFSPRVNTENEKINAVIRLRAMQETNDGFRLSETDLKLRGPGDVLGTKQSGLPDFKYVDLANDVELVQYSLQMAREMLTDDPNLSNPQNTIFHQFIKKQMGKNSSINIA